MLKVYNKILITGMLFLFLFNLINTSYSYDINNINSLRVKDYKNLNFKFRVKYKEDKYVNSDDLLLRINQIFIDKELNVINVNNVYDSPGNDKIKEKGTYIVYVDYYDNYINLRTRYVRGNNFIDNIKVGIGDIKEHNNMHSSLNAVYVDEEYNVEYSLLMDTVDKVLDKFLGIYILANKDQNN